MTDEQRLFGVPGAEELYLSIADAFERQVEPYRDENNPESWPATIEEWTIADNRQFMPSPERVLDEIGQIAANEAVTEWWWEALEGHLDDEDVKAKLSDVLDLLASKVKYWMADRHVATYSITLDADHRPLVDGQPLYRANCPYWPTGRHVFRGHTNGSTDPCRCGAKWNGPKPAIQPERRAKGLITPSGILAAAHGYTVGDELSEAFAAGWVRNLSTPGDEIVDLSTESVRSYIGKDARALRRRPRNENYAEHSDQGKHDTSPKRCPAEHWEPGMGPCICEGRVHDPGKH